MHLLSIIFFIIFRPCSIIENNKAQQMSWIQSLDSVSSKSFELFIWFSVIVLSHPFNIRLSLWFRKDTLHKKSCMSGLSNFYSESVKKLRSSYVSKSHGTHQRSFPSLYNCLHSSSSLCLTLYFCIDFNFLC